MPNKDDPLSSIRRRMREALVAGNVAEATHLVDDAHATGMSVPSIIEEVIAGALREVGEAWHQGQLSVADEHLASESASVLLNAALRHLHQRPDNGKAVLIACVPNEHHTLAPRMAAELLKADGWKVTFLGKGLPPQDLISFLGRQKSDALVLAMALSESLGSALETITLLRAAQPDLPILIGGTALKIPAISKAFASKEVGVIEKISAVIPMLRQACGLRSADSLEDYLEVMGERITHLRKARRWSQQELADQAQLDRTYISGLERGKQNASLAALRRISQALGVTIENLVSEV